MNLETLLHSTFGHSSFRVNQEPVCRAATEGRDVLLVMPTGAGKSLCYQLPAIARGGTALVISPLIALMDDQAGKLSQLGLKVARIHSGLSREDSRQACREYLDGTLQFLFVAPERMRVPSFPEMLARRKPALIAIDEAHCISAWGHDFRPDYRSLGDYLPLLRPAPIIALTATATPTVQKDIVNQLRLNNPALFIHGFRRDNLAIEVVEMSKPRRHEFAAKLLRSPSARPAIVYAPSRKSAEELASTLGGKAAAYHAGLDPSTRKRVQRHFLSGKLDVVVATIAFGMGIDKADVRTVIHTALPASVEAYYQEIGRAGRDGLPSRTVLLHSFVDRRIHEGFLERDYPPVGDLDRVASVLTTDFLTPDPLCRKLKMSPDVFGKSVEKLIAQGAAQQDMAGNIRGNAIDRSWRASYSQQLAFRQSQIDRMVAYAESAQCRMAALIQHFGDSADGLKPCGHCDFCSPTSTTAQTFTEPSSEQDRQLRSILRALQGGSAKSTGKLHTELALGIDRRAFDGYLDALRRAGLVTLTADSFTNPAGDLINFKRVSLTYEGRAITSSAPLGVLLRESDESGASTGRSKKSAKKSLRSGIAKDSPRAALTPSQQKLSDALRLWRKQLSTSMGKPAFLILSDAVIDAVAALEPSTLSQLRSVSGIGPEKAEKYGADIIAICTGATVPATSHRSADSPRPKQLMFGATASGSSGSSRTLVRERTYENDAPTNASYTRVRATESEPTQSLTPDQQVLDQRLRDWRKAESERAGVPQFFILGASALRSIVLSQPRSLSQLRTISGIGPDKIDKFGEAILEACNT